MTKRTNHGNRSGTPSNARILVAVLVVASMATAALPGTTAAPGIVRTSVSIGTLTLSVGSCTASIPAVAVAVYQGTTLHELVVKGADGSLLTGQGSTGNFLGVGTCGFITTGGSTSGLTTTLTCGTDTFTASLSTPAGLSAGYSSGPLVKECLNAELPVLGPKVNGRAVDIVQPQEGTACVGSVSVRLAGPTTVDLPLPGAHDGSCGTGDLCEPYAGNPAIESCQETVFLNQQTIAAVSAPRLALACAYDRFVTLDLNDDGIPEVNVGVLWVEPNLAGAPC